MSSGDYFSAFIIGFAIFYIIIILISLAMAILQIIAKWKLYEKAGEPGWSSIVPVYNYMQMIKIATGSFKLAWIYIALCAVYFIGYFGVTFMEAFADSESFGVAYALLMIGLFVFMIPMYVIAGYTNYMFAKSYGKSQTFCILTIFFSGITLLIMGFDKSTEYVGPKGISPYNNYYNNYNNSNYGNYNNY
mgnify:FL=1